ncbi:Sulfoacetaldehyde dehydrogenase [Candidatus Thermoflexus japonica]|uniref:Sulfoacetaldehyde dehydrogenase n=1 Tax=Candidatus Thermoflexus japonica TaxID=2035417 RepID=A0A2H5Y6A3_9CHLR|nr:Sulfoacetaldehyde dehydrogenase [Candidatus Thermoflexus japonica]
MGNEGRLRGSAMLVTEGIRSEEPLLGEYGILVAGRWIRTGDAVEVRSPYSESVVAVVHRAGPSELETAMAAAARAFEATRRMPSWKRAEILERISAGIASRREEFARTIALEAGKPIRTARVEVDRAIFTFKVAAEEAKRIYGEIVPLDWVPGTEGRMGYVRRVPLGPILGITPFNFPLNLVVHKVAPALAAGNPILIRPSTKTPVSALKLGEVILEAGWPPEGFAVVPCTTQDAELMVRDDRIRMLTFTGSPAVGWGLKARAGRKRVTLELGGNAGVIIHRDADLDYAAERVTWGGFTYAGQSCISVQRVYIHEEIYETFVNRLLQRVSALRVGDPLEETTDVGPVIDREAAERIEAWIQEAIAGGAKVLTGGRRIGNLWEPTILTSIREDMRVSCQEVFGPLIGLYPYTDPIEAIRAVDRSDYGLQAGIFTSDLRLIEAAFEHIEVGGLVVNDVPTFRVDHMPYGGVKLSGFGREGVRYAIEEMTELKLMVLNRL